MRADGAQREPAFAEVTPGEPKVPEPNDFMRAAHTDEMGIDVGTFYSFYLVCPNVYSPWWSVITVLTEITVAGSMHP